MFQKYLQNAEFVFRKVNIMTVPGQGTAGRIQDSTLMFKDISRSSEGIGTAQDCLNLAVSTSRSNGFAIKSSAPRLIAMTIFILSDAEEIKMIGTWEIRRISSHQVKTVIKRQFQDPAGQAADRLWANSCMILEKSSAQETSYPQEQRFFFRRLAMISSSSTMKIRYMGSPFW